MSASDDSLSVDELAAMHDGIGAVQWLVGNHPRWCDVCLRPSVRRVVRRRIEIDVDGGNQHDTEAFYCLDERRFIR